LRQIKAAQSRIRQGWEKPQESPMFERIKKIATLWTEEAEIMALTQRDLDELDVTRDQLLRLARMPANLSDRVAAMAAIFGVNAADLQFPRADYVAILDNCNACHALKHCAHVLADPSAKPADCSFCPNAEAFAAA
jgi:hypothetical protein